MKNVPDQILFKSGLHRGIRFQRGTGPGVRQDLGGGVTMLVNSTNFWYAAGNRAVDAVYLKDNHKDWIEPPTRAQT